MATAQEVQQLYIAYLGRAADQAGLDYWVSGEGAALGLEQLRANFVNEQQEYQDVYGGLSREETLVAIYQNLFERAPDAEGLEYWLTGEGAGVNIDQLLVAFLDGASVEDQAVIDNKLTVAEAYTDAAGDAYDQASARAIIDGITDQASVDAALAQIEADFPAEPEPGVPGETVGLTVGVDNIVGTADDDVINALTVNSTTGVSASTITAFDSIDGGAGNDTLNIYTDGAFNSTLPSNVTIKNVEKVNLFNATGGVAALADASIYQGVTELNQVNAAADVTKLGAETTAGFVDIKAGTLSVAAAATAQSANVRLTNVNDASTLAVLGDALSTVNVRGTVVDAGVNGVDAIDLAVTAGKGVQSLTINTAVDVNLAVNNGADATKPVVAVNAAGSTGAIDYTGSATVANLATGSGDDSVTLATALNGGTLKAASVATGAGNDEIRINSAATGNGNTIAVDAGAGNDEVTVANRGTAALNINLGAGDDTVILTSALRTSDRINGGDGNDTVMLATGGTLVAENYALLRGVMSNVEGLGFGAATTLDASELSQFGSFVFTGGANVATKVGAEQSLIASGAATLTATAQGYVASTATKVAEGGALNVVAQADADVTANASTLNLTVAPEADAAADATVVLAGDFNSATVNLATAVTVDATGQATGNNVAAVEFDAAGKNATSITVAGNGVAYIDNTTGKLATIDVSGLASVDYQGNVQDGLEFIGNAAVKETISLGASTDEVAVASTYAVMDTISGFDAVKETNDGKSTTDILNFGGVVLDGSTTGQATKVALSANATSLELAFVEAAATDTGAGVVFFHFGGDTYLFDNAGTAALEAGDAAVRVVGTIDFADDWGVFATA